jgi:hypothetical protein
VVVSSLVSVLYGVTATIDCDLKVPLPSF